MSLRNQSLSFYNSHLVSSNALMSLKEAPNLSALMAKGNTVSTVWRQTSGSSQRVHLRIIFLRSSTGEQS
jgi:hypothetical protein